MVDVYYWILEWSLIVFDVVIMGLRRFLYLLIILDILMNMVLVFIKIVKIEMVDNLCVIIILWLFLLLVFDRWGNYIN